MTTGRVGTWPERIWDAVGIHLPGSVTRYFTPRMVRMLLIVGGVLLFVFAYILLAPLVRYLMMPKDAFSRAQTVSTVHVQNSLWQSQLRSVGTLHAFQGADLASEVAGLVTRIGFRPDEDVRAGMLLIQLRDDSDRAQLAALRAAADLAAVTYARDAALIKTNAISKTEYDTALANMKGTRAQVASQAAIVEKKAIRAPYDGRVGIRQVDVGQYVNAGQVVVTLQQLDPIYVDFQVPQQQLSVLKTGDKVTLTTDAVGSSTYSGEIVAFDPKVDPVTRNIHVRASVPNPDKKLLPGMFATVVTSVGSAKQLVTLPQTAIVFNPYGDTVFVVTQSRADDGTEQLVAEQRFVTTGDTRGDQIAVTSGLSTKDVVVSAGQLKLKNGTEVKINNNIRLPNNPAPTPVQQ